MALNKILCTLFSIVKSQFTSLSNIIFAGTLWFALASLIPNLWFLIGCKQCTNSFWQLPEGFVQGDAKKSTGINLQYLKGLKTNYLILRGLHSDSFHQMVGLYKFSA